MILGDLCTRACRFCAVSAARQGREVRAGEGKAIAQAALELGLTYLILTSVDRDDLPDRGAGHFTDCVAGIKQVLPDIPVEVLIPDYTQREIASIAAVMPAAVAHNVETVRSLQWIRDTRASFDKSIATLRAAKNLGVAVTKSSLLLGLGEKEPEVLSAMDELREAGVDILVIGQYLQPSPKQIPVTEYLRPEQFDRYAEAGLSRGFGAVIAAPLARTSYQASDAFDSVKRGRKADAD
jgi:lipoic acid synthetase